MALVLASLVAMVVTESSRQEILLDRICFSRPFTPHTTPGDRVLIRFRIARRDRVNATIVSRRGAHVRTILDGHELREGVRHGFTWDGRREDGELVPPAIYRLRVVLVEREREINPRNPLALEHHLGRRARDCIQPGEWELG